MKWFLILWACPVMFLAAWYGLSYYDMSFGFFMLTRQTHDLVFQVYGNVLGIPPESIPPLVARAIIVDSFIVFGIIAFRKRRELAVWYRRCFGAVAAQSAEAPSLARDASLSSAP
ncbi:MULTISPECIES: DUF6105 family protein [Ensifer]|jgi:hypothetical protein|uniref:Transmembrane protein n=1 Tax=Ensifer canadensis TaxID=555315 RepID=A0AAW4FEF9_9HYPH|nr:MULTISPECIES: DUF6105 family protein [Ensifer]MDP9629742.1 hypothetical protein [Ensifer adhaerens]KQU71899.1 hypothetical protein ASD00_13560 [Ensifer sp. Root31]KQW44085.1 hypothetical protein ASD02_12060 [Ensifer sp. Root1252]KQW84236.1 hypothetical protein ASD03_00165 [Ensifer sp. Root127]KQY61162.1 hypothetical protein ASD52_18215 [Ensifer sp. Root142]